MLTVKRSVVAKCLEEGRDEQGTATEQFDDSETILNNTLMANTCHCIFVKIHKMCSTKSEP